MDMKKIKAELGHTADMVSRNRDGNFIARKGFFYPNGKDAENYKNEVLNKLNECGITAICVVYGAHWTSFRGSYKVNKQSHFYCEFKLA